MVIVKKQLLTSALEHVRANQQDMLALGTKGKHLTTKLLAPKAQNPHNQAVRRSAL